MNSYSADIHFSVFSLIFVTNFNGLIYQDGIGANETKAWTSWTLLFSGVSLLLLSVFGVVGIETVIEISFVLGPCDKYGPYDNGTCHHTRVISKSTLTGEVVVEGAGIYFTVNGYNTQHLKNVFINQNYSFVISPADDLYTFTFDNTMGETESSIRFTLKERWINIILLVLGLIGVLMLVPAVISLLIARLREHPSKF